MNVDCRWIEENLEAICCDRLNLEEDRLTRSHLENCTHCRAKFAELTSIDPIIQQIFRHDLAIARTPKVRRSPVLIGGFATAFALILAVLVWAIPPHSNSTAPVIQAPPAVAQVSETSLPNVPKMAETAQRDRAKPEPAPDKAPAANVIPAPAVGENAPDFVVTDPAGYSRTLNDYHGYVLVFGVWGADQPRTISNLEHVYETLGKNTKLRIIGVTLRRQPRPKTATFPIAFNQGSKLLGATQGDLLIVDGTGKTRLRANLLQDPNALLNSIQTTLNQIQAQ